MADLRVVVTGGTLDKVHDWKTESLDFPPSGESHVSEILDEARCGGAVVEVLFLKDSLEFTDADRTRVAEAVRAAPETRLVVTHGTSTMGETARALEAAGVGGPLGKTVVLTGAMRPFSLQRSDAPFNLGAAVIAARVLSAGVFGVMNGRVFAAQDLVKNTELGRFDR